jgi:hypothetical protein
MGAASVFAIIVAALALGGFSFFAPWIIVSPVAMFTAGFLRGPTFGNALPKAVAMNLSILLLLLACFRSTTVLITAATILGIASASVLCTVAGIYFRRRERDSSPHGYTGSERRVLLAGSLTASIIAALWTLLWVFAFVNGLLNGRFGMSVIAFLLAGTGGVLGRRFLDAFRKTKASGTEH